jgi:hypothetical protein
MLLNSIYSLYIRLQSYFILISILDSVQILHSGILPTHLPFPNLSRPLQIDTIFLTITFTYDTLVIGRCGFAMPALSICLFPTQHSR